jgi:hypothetical protein
MARRVERLLFPNAPVSVEALRDQQRDLQRLVEETQAIAAAKD